MHTIADSKVVHRPNGVRRTIICSCGKRMTGWNNRAMQSFFKHQREALTLT